MKVRPILVLLLFAGSVGVLGWMYYAVTRPALQATTLRDEEVLRDLDDCCRRKHVKSAQYDHFATIAAAEKEPSAASLFRAMAHSERVQEAQCALIITKLGGSYRPPARILLFRGTTAGNIARSIDYERRSEDTLYRARIARNLHAGNRLAARMLIWASAADLRHRLLLEGCRRTEHATTGYAVCPGCGNIYRQEACDSYCPHCLTQQQRFVRFLPRQGE